MSVDIRVGESNASTSQDTALNTSKDTALNTSQYTALLRKPASLI